MGLYFFIQWPSSSCSFFVLFCFLCVLNFSFYCFVFVLFCFNLFSVCACVRVCVWVIVAVVVCCCCWVCFFLVIFFHLTFQPTSIDFFFSESNCHVFCLFVFSCWLVVVVFCFVFLYRESPIILDTQNFPLLLLLLFVCCFNASLPVLVH